MTPDGAIADPAALDQAVIELGRLPALGRRRLLATAVPPPRARVRFRRFAALAGHHDNGKSCWRPCLTLP
jgi:hypothetical protein